MREINHEDIKNHWLLCAEVVAAAERLVNDVLWHTIKFEDFKKLTQAVGALQADRRRMGLSPGGE